MDDREVIFVRYTICDTEGVPVTDSDKLFHEDRTIYSELGFLFNSIMPREVGHWIFDNYELNYVKITIIQVYPQMTVIDTLNHNISIRKGSLIPIGSRHTILVDGAYRTAFDDLDMKEPDCC